MFVLGIESSCDETAVAIINDKGDILAQALLSQITTHQPYGGVVPEVAARSHVEVIDILLDKVFTSSDVSLNDIDAFVATCGPGLVGGLIVGALSAKTLAMINNKPFIAVNHLVGHALLPTMTNDIKFPFLLLLASGGHTQFLAVLDYNKYILLGKTIDDALGETFDKSARMLDLPYPGGPNIQKLAFKGNKERFSFPKPLYKKAGCDFSFSGLKTAVRNTILTLKQQAPLQEQDIWDISASLQQTIADIINDRTKHAIAMFEEQYGSLETMVLSGGVAANLCIRNSLKSLLDPKNITFISPPPTLCTDNAVMIAWAGLIQFKQQKFSDLSFPIRPRWPITDIL